MTKHTEQFMAQYQKSYGRSYAERKPDFARCAAHVSGNNGSFESSQCRRKNGHGPHGAWCKQHDPEAREARHESRQKMRMARWDADNRDRKLKLDSVDAIRKIAAGHNDPRGLAQRILDEAGK